jgi:aerobic-type carbon monoxide dehydrogenase small subunit (CoxS/CutS family)
MFANSKSLSRIHPQRCSKLLPVKASSPQRKAVQSGFCKGFKVMVSHRFLSKFDVSKTSNKRGCGIYDYQQAYRKTA